MYTYIKVAGVQVAHRLNTKKEVNVQHNICLTVGGLQPSLLQTLQSYLFWE